MAKASRQMDVLILVALLGCWLVLIGTAVVAPFLPATRADSDLQVLPLLLHRPDDGDGTQAA